MQTPSGSARKGKGKAKSKGRSTGKASSNKKGRPNSAAAAAASSSRSASSSAQASRRPPPTSSKKSLAARLQQQVTRFDEIHARLADALEDFLRVAGDGQSYGTETTLMAMHDLPAKFSAQLGGVDRLDAKAEKRRVFELTKGGSETQDQPLVRASVMEAENLLFEIKGVLLAELERTVNSMAQISVDSQEAEGKPPAQSWSEQREIVERYCSEYELAESVCAPLNRETNTDVLRTHILALRSRPFLKA